MIFGKNLENFRSDFNHSFTFVMDKLGMSTDIAHKSKFHGESYLEHCRLVFEAMEREVSVRLAKNDPLFDQSEAEDCLWLAILHDIAKPRCADGKGGFPNHGPEGAKICRQQGFAHIADLVHHHLTVIFPLKEEKVAELATTISWRQQDALGLLIAADRAGSICPNDVAQEEFLAAQEKSMTVFRENMRKLDAAREKARTAAQLMQTIKNTRTTLVRLAGIHAQHRSLNNDLTFFVATDEASDDENLSVFVYLADRVKATARLSRKALAAMGACVREGDIDALERRDEVGDSHDQVSPGDFDPTESQFMSPKLCVCLDPE